MPGLAAARFTPLSIKLSQIRVFFAAPKRFCAVLGGVPHAYGSAFLPGFRAINGSVVYRCCLTPAREIHRAPLVRFAQRELRPVDWIGYAFDAFNELPQLIRQQLLINACPLERKNPKGSRGTERQN